MAEQNYRPYEEDEVNLLDYWWVVWKYKILVGMLCLTSMLATSIYGFLSPKIYESTATLLMPKEGGGGGFLSLIATTGLSSFAGAGTSLTPNRDLFFSIIKSRLMAQNVAARFNLKERFRIATTEEAIEAAMGIAKVSQTKEGVIEIRVED